MEGKERVEEMGEGKKGVAKRRRRKKTRRRGGGGEGNGRGCIGG